MGRIAEALKRAERERERRLDDGAGAHVDAVDASVDRSQQRREAGDSDAEHADALTRAAILKKPHPIPTFQVRNTPIEPEAVGPEVVAFHDPTCEISEKYRSVRTRLLTGNPEGSARAFVVTSSLPREGKTVTTANLGFSLSELRHFKVAFVDLDFRQGGLSTLFGVADRPGIIEVLQGEQKLSDVCIPVVKENLFLVPAGDFGDVSPSELLAGPRVTATFKELHERFHYTLMDTPPVNTVADIGLIAPLCHSVVMVIRMNRTPEPLLRRSVKLLQANHVALAGCICAGYCADAMRYTDTHDYFDAGT